MVRYEGDGYLPALHRPSILHSKVVVNETNSPPRPSEEKTNLVRREEASAFVVEAGGEAVPQSAVFDLKTRNVQREYADVLQSQLPRLWVAQVPNFVVAFHKTGVFQEVRVEDIRDEVKQWEEKSKSDLDRFLALLKRLIAFAHAQPDGRFEVVFRGAEGDGELELREVGGEFGCCISESMKERLNMG